MNQDQERLVVLWQAAFDQHVGNELGLWCPNTCDVCQWLRETMPNEIAVGPVPPRASVHKATPGAQDEGGKA